MYSTQLEIYILQNTIIALKGVYRGRILGRNPDKSLKSFPPCYSQSPLQLCLEISIFSNLCNLVRNSTIQLLYNVQ